MPRRLPDPGASPSDRGRQAERFLPPEPEAVLPNECLTRLDPAFFLSSPVQARIRSRTLSWQNECMTNRRRRRGFEHAGSLPLDRLGLPRNRARDLILAQAWEHVAGSALAAQARVVRVQRGVLEIEVACGRWTETLSEFMPGLTGRLSRLYPELGVRKFRLIRPDSDEHEPPQPVEVTETTPHSRVAQEAPELPGKTLDTRDPRPQAERLEELAQRYVERGKNQNQ